MDIDAGDEHLHDEDHANVDDEAYPDEDEEYPSCLSEDGQNYSNQCDRLRRERELNICARF